jgi:glycolate oxidase
VSNATKADESLIGELCRVLPRDRVAGTAEELLVYGYDGTWLDEPPGAVVLPRDAAEVASVLRLASRLDVPVVPRGAGSGLAGGSVPRGGGIVLSLTLFDRIREISTPDRLAVVEPGVVNAQLQAAVEKQGLFYPPDPASLKQATIGGNIATSASGPRCLKYGGTREYVLGLEVVTAAGEIVRLGGRAPTPGLDAPLLNLFVGSEGTLGVVTEATLRLIAKPAARGTVLAVFPRLDDASRAVSAILGAGIVPLAFEMMDQTTLGCVEKHLKIGLPLDVEAVLLIDVDGEAAEVARQCETVATVARAGGSPRVEIATDAAASDRLWQARRSVSSSFGRLRPNKLGEDISVPRSAIPETVRRIQEIATRSELIIPLFGHIGDGNLHPNILCDLRDRAEMARVARAAEEIFAVALSLGGMLSGEHGIGLLKRGFLPTALDPLALALMRDLKRQLDPKRVLNPGKLL